ncbi:anti-sigma factor [Stakelama sp. CBK3Z-3]|uniref:Anti-sigma factor n=1 Tax=Stakelama flava TaxID=2860338 RepID=A0ABS6XJT8_9SPHN|nr:anti-sigma factor [Stakelama flava]MBW4330473.1 anti-sigma factor [Stakelama flava]
MTEPDWNSDEFDVLAGELAIGVLEGDARAEALRLQLSDARFAERVEAWQLRLGPLLSRIPETPAPASLWPAIERRLSDQTEQRPVSTLRRWQAATFVTGAAAALFAGLFFVRPSPEPVIVTRDVPRPVLVQAATARLGKADSGPSFAARYDPLADRLRIEADGVNAGERVPQLWVIPADGTPRSLGLISGSGSSQVAVPPALRAYLRPGSSLAVSLENTQGAPHTAPEGEIIATGTIFEI